MVLNNLSLMLSIMIEKMGNPRFVSELNSPIAKNTNSHMPSLDPLLNSVAGSAGDPPARNALR